MHSVTNIICIYCYKLFGCIDIHTLADTQNNMHIYIHISATVYTMRSAVLFDLIFGQAVANAMIHSIHCACSSVGLAGDQCGPRQAIQSRAVRLELRKSSDNARGRSRIRRRGNIDRNLGHILGAKDFLCGWESTF